MVRQSHFGSGVHSSNCHQPRPSRLPLQSSSAYVPAATKLDPGFERHASNTFSPLYFKMFVADTPRNPQSSFHTFTGLDKSPQLADTQLEVDRLWDWRTAFPRLADLHSGSLPCQTILAEATISLLPDDFKPQGELTVLFEMVIPKYVATLGDLHCRTTFFSDGNFLQKSDGKEPVMIDKYSRGQLSFGSRFWADKAVEWLKVLRTSSPENKARSEEAVDDALHRLSAVQEVYYHSGSGERQVLLLICWKFERTRASQGVTSWRYVVDNLSTKPATRSEDPVSQLFVGQPVSDYQQADSSVANLFEHGAFDIGDLANLHSLPMDLEPTTVGEEMYPSNGIDFNGGSIQLCLDSSVPMEGYADVTQSFDQFQQELRGSDWTTPYPNLFDQPYAHTGFEQGIEQNRDDATLGAQGFSMSPLSHMRTERGVVSGM